MIQLTATLYLTAFQRYPSHVGIVGGTIHDFLYHSAVKYHGGKCPVYLIEHYHNGNRAVIGGNYATAGKPVLRPYEVINFD
jgi:hypothetical protein